MVTQTKSLKTDQESVVGICSKERQGGLKLTIVETQGVGAQAQPAAFVAKAD